MPIYEYECANCGVFELMRRITEGPIKRCPKCKAKVERIVSRTSFVLKGSGWYSTDYAPRSPAAPTSESTTSGAEAGSSSNGTTQASPATGSDAGASSSKKAGADAPKSPAAKAAD